MILLSALKNNTKILQESIGMNEFKDKRIYLSLIEIALKLKICSYCLILFSTHLFDHACSN